MKNLKRLGVAIALTFALGAIAFAGETSTPPAAPPPPDDISALAVSSTYPGEMQVPSVVSTGSQTSFTEFAASVLQSILPLF